MDHKVTLSGGKGGNPLFAVPLVILLLISLLSVKPEIRMPDVGNLFKNESVTQDGTELANADSSGGEIFILSNFLYRSLWAVSLAGVVLCLIVVKCGKKVNTLLLLLYLVFIVYMTLMYRETGTGHINLELFWSYKMFWAREGLRVEILNNIWLFVPLGAILYRLLPRYRVLLVPLLLSLCIEGAQYVFDIGLFELDDIFSNSLGGLIGYWASRSFGPPADGGLWGIRPEEE